MASAQPVRGTTITMPQLGESVTEGTVAQWLKRVGDTVEKYEAFCEVSTDKVNAEIPSPLSGTIRELIVKEGDTVPTGAPIAVIEETSPSSQPMGAYAGPMETPRDVPSVGAAAAAAPAANGTSAPSKSNGAHATSPEVLRGVSPAVRRLAREHSIDVSALAGTGANGRVTADDVLAAARLGPAAAVGAAVAAGPAPTALPPAKTSYASPLPGQTIPLTQARKIIAQRMTESKHTAPHAWSTVEVDVTKVWKWRSSAKDTFARDYGVALTLLPFFIRAVVESLAVFPLMNAKFTEDGIYVHKDVNIGIAIGLETNLVVPVIRDADQLSIKGLALAAGALIDKARRGKLTADDLSGGTFTVNNTGANGSVLSAPIINAGQAGIVTMEAVVKRPVVTDDDAIAIRSMMNVCLSLDHRVIDGAIASGFLSDLKKRLQAMGPSGAL